MSDLEIAFDEGGFLQDPHAWDRDVAKRIARRLGLSDLSERHLAVLVVYREHYLSEHALSPTADVCHQLGMEQDWVEALFGGPMQAWKCAGLPDPGEEAKAYLDGQSHDSVHEPMQVEVHDRFGGS